MARPGRSAAVAVFGLTLAGCAPQAAKPLIDPFPLKLPFVEAGTLDIDGHVVGQPRAHDGIVYMATREGVLTAVVVSPRCVLGRFRADHPFSAGPELGDNRVIVRDDASTLYVLDAKGSLLFKTSLKNPATTAVRESGGRLFYGAADGAILALDVAASGTPLWEYRPASTQASVTAGPVFADDLVIFGGADGRLVALDRAAGRPAWEFAAEGAIRVDPASHGGRAYFGTNERVFYCLNASTGKKIWSRRLQGAAVHPAIIGDGILAVSASNSVVYRLSSMGGSILSWEAVRSRIVYDLARADSLVLVSSAAPAVVALDLKTGRRAGPCEASGPLVAGAVWSPPFLILFGEDQDSGRQRLTLLRSR